MGGTNGSHMNQFPVRLNLDHTRYNVQIKRCIIGVLAVNLWCNLGVRQAVRYVENVPSLHLGCMFPNILAPNLCVGARRLPTLSAGAPASFFGQTTIHLQLLPCCWGYPSSLDSSSQTSSTHDESKHEEDFARDRFRPKLVACFCKISIMKLCYNSSCFSFRAQFQCNFQ